MAKLSLLFFWPAGMSTVIYLGVLPVSEGTLHSFKIKLTRGKTCPFLQRGSRTGRALCRCCGHALTHIISGWTQTSRRLDTPYFPFFRNHIGCYARKQNNAVQVSCGLLHQLNLKPSSDMKKWNKMRESPFAKPDFTNLSFITGVLFHNGEALPR